MSSQPLVSVKEEPQDEEFDDYLHKYILANQTLNEEPNFEQDIKHEISPNVPDQDIGRNVNIKEEEEVGQSSKDDPSAKSKSSWTIYRMYRSCFFIFANSLSYSDLKTFYN